MRYLVAPGTEGLVSLGIAFKGPEGIVLAADSRVTLMALKTGVAVPTQPGQPAPPQAALLPATFDNATKLLKVKGQNYVGAVTYGLALSANGNPALRAASCRSSRQSFRGTRQID